MAQSTQLREASEAFQTAKMMVGTYPPLPDEHLPPPPLPEDDEEPPPLPEEAPPLPDEDAPQLALIDPKNPPLPPRPGTPSEEEEESEPDEDLPPGPADPDQCIVVGPGTQGGCALRSVRFKIIVKDARGKALREGGDYIVARVSPGTAAQVAGAEDVSIEVEDQGDGTYMASYQVPVRGDYKVGIVSTVDVSTSTPCDTAHRGHQRCTLRRLPVSPVFQLIGGVCTA